MAKIGDINNVAPGAFFLKDPVTGQYVSPNPPSGSTQPTFNANDFRPLANYQDIYIITHGSYANYNSLQMSWQKQSGPVTFISNYTFSKVLGIHDGQTSNGGGNGTVTDPFNRDNNYGPLAYDHTNIFNFAYVWNLPKPIHGNAALAEIVNGWQNLGLHDVPEWRPPSGVNRRKFECFVAGQSSRGQLPYVTEWHGVSKLL